MRPSERQADDYPQQPDARFSTYSGAPSIQPSLALTMDTTSTSNRSSTARDLYYTASPTYNGRVGEQQYPANTTGGQPYYRPANAPANFSHGPYNPPRAPQSTTAGASSSRAGMHASSLSLDSTSAADAREADIQSFARLLDKLAEPRLDRQRYVMSGHKTEEVSKIALGAKVERALSRRMTGQDAAFRAPSSGSLRHSGQSGMTASREKSLDEKAFEAITAN